MAKKIVDPKIQARETAEIVEDAFRNVSNEIGKIFAKSLDQTESFAKTLQKDVTGALNSLAKTSTVIEEVLSKQKAGQLKLADIEKIKEQRAIKLKTIQLQFNIAQKNAIGGSTIQIKLAKDLEKQINEATIAEGELNEELNKFGNQADKNNKKLGATGAIMKGLTKIPILGGLINAETVLAKIQKETAREGSTRFSVFKEGIKGVGSSIKETLTDPATLMTGGLSIASKLFNFFWEAMMGASKQQAEIAKSFNVSYESAKGIRDQFFNLKGIAKTFTKDLPEGATILEDELVKANIQINNLLGQSLTLTDELGDTGKELVVQFTRYTKLLDLSNEEQQALLSINAQTGASVEETTRSLLGQAKLYKLKTGYQIDERKVLRDVLTTSNSIKLSIKGGTDALVQATINAGKLGTNLEGLKSTSSALLNFEQSISDELSAELLLQRDINLDAARQAALTNDQLGLTEEVGKLIASFGPDFQKNSLAQEAFAKTLGKSKEEIADMYTSYKQMEATRNNQLKLDDKEIANLIEKKAITADQGKLLEQGKLSGVEFYDALKTAGYEGQKLTDALAGLSLTALESQSAQDKFNDAISSLKETLSSLVGSGVVDKLADGLSVLAEVLASGGSIWSPTGESDFTKAMRGKQYEKQMKFEEGLIKKEKSGDELTDEEKEVLRKRREKEAFVDQVQKDKEEKTFGGFFTDLLSRVPGFGRVGYGLASGGIIPPGYQNDTFPARLSSNEAVIPLDQLMAKFDAMANAITSNKQSEPKIYLGYTELNTATSMGTYGLNQGVTS